MKIQVPIWLIALALLSGGSAYAQRNSFTMLGTLSDFAALDLNAAHIPDRGTLLVGLGGSIDVRSQSGVLDQSSFSLMSGSIASLLNRPDMKSGKVGLDLGFNTKWGFLSYQLTFNWLGEYTVDPTLRALIQANPAQLAGKNIETGGFGEYRLGYQEHVIGISTDRLLSSRRLKVGARVKLLDGFDYEDSKPEHLTLGFDANGELSQASLRYTSVRTGASGGFAPGNPKMGEAADRYYRIGGMPGGRATGWGIDLGVEYDLTRDLSFGLALNDLGYLVWNRAVEVEANWPKESPYHFVNGESKPSDSHIDKALLRLKQIDDLLDKDVILKQHISSLRTWLPAQFYLTSTYKPTHWLQLKALAGASLYRTKASWEGALALVLQPTKWLGATVTYSSIPRTRGEFGTGLVLGQYLQFALGVDGLGRSKHSARGYMGLHVRI
ncbi:MAG: DUF5723 family protein [Porphyromonadaceae bacterium]|nr:DUF5723 family protein [Porphyromonadaceae bacterium]